MKRGNLVNSLSQILKHNIGSHHKRDIYCFCQLNSTFQSYDMNHSTDRNKQTHTNKTIRFKKKDKIE